MVLTRRQKRVNAACSVQRCYKKWKKRHATIDPITKTRPEDPIFVFVAQDGVETIFDGVALAEYIADTGDIKHPLTRKPFSPLELSRLQRIVGPSLVINDSERNQRRRKDLMEELSVLAYLEDAVLSNATEMIDLANNADVSTNSIVRRYIMNLFPFITGNIMRILQVSADAAISICEELKAIMQHTQHDTDMYYNATALLIARGFVDDLIERIKSNNLPATSNLEECNQMGNLVALRAVTRISPSLSRRLTIAMRDRMLTSTGSLPPPLV